MMIKLAGVTKKGVLTVDQKCWFVKGYKLHQGEPFADEDHLGKSWERHKPELMLECTSIRVRPSHIFEGMACPGDNQLRPAEWFKRDAPEPRRILNDAERIPAEKCKGRESCFDKAPLQETDFEYLSRLSLLTEADLKYIQTSTFKEEEKRALNYRAYVTNQEEQNERKRAPRTEPVDPSKGIVT